LTVLTFGASLLNWAKVLKFIDNNANIKNRVSLFMKRYFKNIFVN
jgi:hypothetical protein